jgi:integrase
MGCTRIMPPKGSRRRLDTNIYADASGITVRVGKLPERRFGLGTPLILLRQVREAMQKIHDKTKTTGAATLQRDAVRYLQRKAHLVNQSSVKAELDAWCARYGAQGRHTLTRDDVLDARAAWLEQGLSPKTVNNRVHRLRALFRELDGPDCWCPTDGLTGLTVPRTPIQRVSPALILRVIDTMATSMHARRLRKTIARFMVYATTGRRPSEIARAERSDVDFDNRVWVPRDGKGGFTPGIYLNDDMLFAWTAFDRADAWGAFNSRVFPRTLRRYGWPAGVRPYNLRHSIGLALSESGFDLADIGPHLGHRRPETTRKHYIPVLGSRLQTMSEAIGDRIGLSFPQEFPTNPPKSWKDTRGNGSHETAAVRGKKGR